MQTIKILFICLGNICRSPIAHAIMQYKINQQGLSKLFEISSAGTSSFHTGDSPDIRSINVLLKHDIKFKHHAKLLTTHDIAYYDYIIAMDHLNYDEIVNLAHKSLPQKVKSIFLLRSFDLNEKSDFNIPDPYYGLDSDFEEVFEICERAINGFLRFLQTQGVLSINNTINHYY